MWPLKSLTLLIYLAGVNGVSYLGKLKAQFPHRF